MKYCNGRIDGTMTQGSFCFHILNPTKYFTGYLIYHVSDDTIELLYDFFFCRVMEHFCVPGMEIGIYLLLFNFSSFVTKLLNIFTIYIFHKVVENIHLKIKCHRVDFISIWVCGGGERNNCV